MQIELYCDACTCRFCAPPDATPNEVTDRMFENGPWYALGDGETFEDMIFATITEQGHIDCPECGAPVSVSEESLGRMAMTLLSQI
jgi:hypothetical protein